MSSTPTWFRVARRPKWIGAFFIAMAVAAICALLAQWQVSRSFEKAVTQEQVNDYKPISDVLAVSEPAPQWAVGTQVFIPIFVDTRETFVIANRYQEDGTKGYWLVARGSTKEGDHIVVTLGFAENLEKAHDIKVQLGSQVSTLAARTRPDLIPGMLMPSEAPQLRPTNVIGTDVYESLSIGQLANLWQDFGGGYYPLFLLVTEPEFTAEGLDPIKVTPPSTEVQINWLSAFYAIEWSVFCGFAFFLWWRLVRDEQLVERGER